MKRQRARGWGGSHDRRTPTFVSPKTLTDLLDVCESWAHVTCVKLSLKHLSFTLLLHQVNAHTDHVSISISID